MNGLNGETRGNGLPTPAWEANPESAGERIEKRIEISDEIMKHLQFYEAQGNEILVWKKRTWGSYGQHANRYTFIITPDLKQKAIFEIVATRCENHDSNRNIRRLTFAKIDDILKLDNHIMKIVDDIASSRRRDINVTYYLISNGIIKLDASTGMRDDNGFYDEVRLPSGKTLKVYKDRVVEE